MIKKIILLTLILGIFLISLNSAHIDSLGTFKQNECIQLPQSCTTCSYNNISRISVDGVNSAVIVSEELSMEKNGILYNYTFCNTSALGKYIVSGHQDLGETDTIWNYVFTITSTGELSNNIIPIFLLISGIILLSFGIGIKNPAIGFFSGILFMITGIYLMIYGFGNIANLYSRAFALVIIALGLLVSVLSAYSWIDEGGT